MIRKEDLADLRRATAKKRESLSEQAEALADTRELRDFACANNLVSDAIELFFEEALIQQHFYMEGKDPSSLKKMKAVLTEAEEYIRHHDLIQWESRLARFMGRVGDYEQNYSQAASYYQKAIDKLPLDPQYADNKAMIFEYRGFLIMDELRLGDLSTGVTKAEKLYHDYDHDPLGRGLKTKDYTTWAIWRTGVLINLCRTLIEMGQSGTYRSQIKEWLALAEKDLQPPKGVRVWSDFGFRKNEIADLREKS